MAKQDSTTKDPVSLSRSDVSIIQAYLVHLERAVKSLRQLAGDLAFDDETPLRSEVLGALADKVETAAKQIGYYFDPSFAEHREETDQWIKRLEKARDENFARLGIMTGPQA